MTTQPFILHLILVYSSALGYISNINTVIPFAVSHRIPEPIVSSSLNSVLVDVVVGNHIPEPVVGFGERQPPCIANLPDAATMTRRSPSRNRGLPCGGEGDSHRSVREGVLDPVGNSGSNAIVFLKHPAWTGMRRTPKLNIRGNQLDSNNLKPVSYL